MPRITLRHGVPLATPRRKTALQGARSMNSCFTATYLAVGFSSFASLIGSALFFFFFTSPSQWSYSMHECVHRPRGSRCPVIIHVISRSEKATSVNTKARSGNSSLVRFEQLERSKHSPGCRVAHLSGHGESRQSSSCLFTYEELG
ncbi:hypothetical protein CGRA01v4_01413 [Colletotrichum graminicola]|nr:hypothetical protein CGRA01v4_01413 [Colletotrichum graminicola]